MLQLSKIFIFLLCIIGGLLALGVHVSRRTIDKNRKTDYDKTTEKLVSVLTTSETFTQDTIQLLSNSTGLNLIVDVTAGFISSNEEILSSNYVLFENMVHDREHDSVRINVNEKTYVFKSIPVFSHSSLKHIFIEEPLIDQGTYDLSKSEKLLLVLSVFLVTLLISLLYYVFYYKPILHLADALERSELEKKITVEYTNRGGSVGFLARTLRKVTSKHKQEKTQEIEEEKIAVFRRLTMGIAHEVRNPLTAMRMTTQMMEKKFKGKDPVVEEWLSVLKGEIVRLKNHMDQLMEFGGQHDPVLSQTDIPDFIKETLLLLRRQLDHARISTVLTFDDSLPLVFLDRDQIKQVLINIILNSVQAMPKGGTLSISANLAKIEGKMVCTIALEDDGPGIPAQVRDKIFEPFVSTKKAGTGLGLSIAKRIIEQHGGRIRFVTSKKGTIFRMFLPVTPEGSGNFSLSTDVVNTLEGLHDKSHSRNR